MKWLVRLIVLNPLHDLARRPSATIPALDALRSLAVALVIVAHFSAALSKEGGSANWFAKLPIVSGGRIGVDLFFVLSGYLIGGQLWREFGTRGTVSLGRFVTRRIFRIWPLYFFFYAFVTFVLNSGVSAWHGWSDLIFMTNYLNHGIVMGSWSLCIEEQFYIAAPLVVLIGSSYRLSMHAFGKILLSLLLLLPLLRALIWWKLTGDFQHRNNHVFASYIYQPIHTHADGLVIGMLIALYRCLNEKRAVTGFFTSGYCILAAAIVFGIGHIVQREVFDFLGMSLIFGSMVQYCLSNRPKYLAFMNGWYFYVISRLSYGMYLNHEYMADGVARITNRGLPFLSGIPALREMIGALVLTVFSVLLSLITYCLIEHPFLHFRDLVLNRRTITTDSEKSPPPSSSGRPELTSHDVAREHARP
jgi:peptidoglycan/LPS O-acetylase OafA/YrhL